MKVSNVSSYQWKQRKNKKVWRKWVKISNLIRSVTKKLDNYDEEYMKIKFDLDDNLTLNKMIEISIVTIVVRAVFMKTTNIIPKFLNECLYKR